jgi:outer membrane cobalamin receptor
MKRMFPLRISRSFLIPLFLILISSFLPSLALSQSALKIYGQVFDRGGALSDVIVKVHQTNYAAITDRNGYYYIYNIPSGEYYLAFEHNNISIATGDKIAVNNGPPVRRDIYFGQNVINIAPVLTEADPEKQPDYHGLDVKIYQVSEQSLESIESILKEIPGLNIISSPATGELFISAAGIRPQGFNVLIDGRKINSLLTGRADLNQIPISAIGQIEYISSGTTAGAVDGGLGGTINFVTNGTIKPSAVSLKGKRGSFAEETYIADISYYHPLYGNINAIYESNFARNDYDYRDYFNVNRTRENARIRNNKYYLSYSNSFNNLHLGLSGYGFSVKNGVPGRTIEPLPEAFSSKTTISLGGEAVYDLSPKMSIKTLLSFLNRITRYEDFGSFINYNTEYKEHEYEISMTPDYSLSNELKLSATMAHTYSRLQGMDHLRPQTALGIARRDISKIQAGASYRKKIYILRLSAGASLAETIVNNRSLSSFAGNSSVTYGEHNRIGLNVSLARSYRLPGLAELNWQEDVFVLSNPDLKPEKAKSIAAEIFSEFGLSGRWLLSLQYQDIRYHDLIYWRRSEGIKYKPLNITASDYFGTTLGISYEAPGNWLEIRFSRVVSRALNREDNPLYYGKYITFQPLYTNNLSLKLNYLKAYVKADMFDSSHRYFIEENTKKLDPYTLVGLSFGYSYKIKFITSSIEFNIKNLTNAEYELLEYQPMPPRSYHFSLAMKI